MAKKLKRMSKQELRAPDKIEVTLKRGWKWVESNKKLVVALIVIAVGAVIGGMVTDKMAQSANDSDAAAVRKATQPLLMPIIEDETDATELAKTSKLPVFTDEAAKNKAGLASITAFLKDHAGLQAAATFQFAQASLQIATGATDAGTKGLTEWVSKHPKSPIAGVALAQLADAQLAKGEEDAARKTASQLVDRSQGTGKVLALVRLGDLSNPLIVKKGDVAAARKHYEAAQALIKDKKEHPLSDALALRLAVLP